MKNITIAILLVSIITACSTEKGSKEKTNIVEEKHKENIVYLTKQQITLLKLKFGNIQKRNIKTTIKVDGKLQVPPQYQSAVSSPIAGKVKSIKIFYGDKVNKGQVLAILEYPSFLDIQQEFYKTAKQMKYMQQEYNRQKELYENNVGAGKEYQKAKSEYEAIKAKYEKLKMQLNMINIDANKVEQGIFSNTISIKSPIKGSITKINIKLGSFVNPNDIMFEVVDNSKMYADFLVYEKDIQYVKKGQKIFFYITSVPDKEIKATVFSITKKFEDELNAIRIYAKIEDNIEDFVPGMYLTGNLQINDNYTSSLPIDAVVIYDDKSYIFVKSKTSTNKQNSIPFRMVEIKTGVSDHKYIEVHLLEKDIDTNAIVLNGAYYILAEMKKEEAEEGH